MFKFLSLNVVFLKENYSIFLDGKLYNLTETQHTTLGPCAFDSRWKVKIAWKLTAPNREFLYTSQSPPLNNFSTFHSRARNKANKRRSQGHLNKAPAWVPQGQFAPKPLMGDRDDQRLKNVRQEAAEMRIKVRN